MGCLLPAEAGFHPAPARPQESHHHHPTQSWVCSDTWNQWKMEQAAQTHGVFPPKAGLYGWAHTHSIKRLVPQKSPESGEMLHLSRSASAQRATQVLPNRVWPSICHSHGERQRSKLLGLPFLLRVNASWAGGTCRRSIASGTPQFTQPGLNAIKRGAPFTGGPRMQKRRPLDHSNYSIDITQCHSGTCWTHQTLLFTGPGC